MPATLEDFARDLVSEPNLTELELCVRLAWFIAYVEKETDLSLTRVVSELHSFGLRHNINKSRLGSSINQSKRARFANGIISIPLATRMEFETTYNSHLASPIIAIDDTVLCSENFSNDTKFIQGLVRQINACYQFGAFDGCAVIMRRLIESLLILAFLKNGLRADILKDNNYITLDEIIVKIKSHPTLKLARGTPKTLEKIKAIGDRAAHSTSHLTELRDISDLQADFRASISDIRAL